MAFVFWFSVLFVIYGYLGYPALLYAVSLIRNRPVNRDETYQPSLSLIITVHNEADRIRAKLENSLSLVYPADRLEIIVASDASTDGTDNIVQEQAGVRLVRAPERKGKEFAQQCAVQEASGEILVFSDVATRLDRDGLQRIAANFADSTVGCVSSEDRFLDERGGVSGEGAYVRYEMHLRRLESRTGSLVGLSGSFFAARREVCRDWSPDLQSDFNTLLNSIKRGQRGISDPLSLGYYTNLKDERGEFNRKVRTVVRGLSVLRRNLDLLNPFAYGLFAWKLFSHKVCRWCVPFFLLAALLSNAALLGVSMLYGLIFSLQLIFYIAAPAFLLLKRLTPESHSIVMAAKAARIAYYFCIVNASIAYAWLRFLQGDRRTFWEPSKR